MTTPSCMAWLPADHGLPADLGEPMSDLRFANPSARAVQVGPRTVADAARQRRAERMRDDCGFATAPDKP